MICTSIAITLMDSEGVNELNSVKQLTATDSLYYQVSLTFY